MAVVDTYVRLSELKGPTWRPVAGIEVILVARSQTTVLSRFEVEVYKASTMRKCSGISLLRMGILTYLCVCRCTFHIIVETFKLGGVGSK